MATSPELLALFRINPIDSTTPYRWTDAQVYSWLSEGQREACIRSMLIKDTETESVCRVSITSGTANYTLSPFIVRVMAVFIVDSNGTRTKIDIFDREELDRVYPEWRTEEGAPTGCVIEELSLILNRIPTEDATIYLEVQRLPLSVISASSQPEIPEIHQEEIVSWAWYRAYQVEDEEEEKPSGKWARHLDKFESYFGKKPTADLRRKRNVNRPHRTKAWW